jgi:hypothetical protein
MDGTQNLPCERRRRLEELVRNCEIRIVEAERRIASHQRLWSTIAANPGQHRAHSHLERNLLEGLMLLHTQRTIALHELSGAKIPRRIADLAQGYAETSAEADAVRHAQLERRLAWLDELPPGASPRHFIAGQRERALRELFDIKNRQLRRTGQPLFNGRSGRGELG